MEQENKVNSLAELKESFKTFPLWFRTIVVLGVGAVVLIGLQTCNGLMVMQTEELVQVRDARQEQNGQEDVLHDDGHEQMIYPIEYDDSQTLPTTPEDFADEESFLLLLSRLNYVCEGGSGATITISPCGRVEEAIGENVVSALIKVDEIRTSESGFQAFITLVSNLSDEDITFRSANTPGVLALHVYDDGTSVLYSNLFENSHRYIGILD